MWLVLGEPQKSGGWWGQRVAWGQDEVGHCSEGGGTQLKALSRIVI